METLGQKLHHREVREAADGMLKLERMARQEGEQAQENLKMVARFFDTLRQAIVEDISEDLPVRKLTLGKSGDSSEKVASILNVSSWNDRYGSIERASHYYHPVWAQFDKWATSEDLKVAFIPNHDGGGMQSWQELRVLSVQALNEQATLYESA